MKRYLIPLLALALTVSAAHAATPLSSIGDELNLNVPVVQDTGSPVLTVDSINTVLADQVDMASLYYQVVKAQKEARMSRLLAVAKAIRAERAAVLINLEKSLLEREAARVEADTAMPENSPAAIPFSTSRPDDLVSTEVETSADSLARGMDLGSESLANTPEPSTWALFGLGAALMIFVFPQQTVRKQTVPVKL